MKVAIVVLNWNGRSYIQPTLDSLTKLDTASIDVEIVVVDNASTDGSAEWIKQAYPNFTFLQTGSNLGYAAGNNAGLRYALSQGTDYVWIVNSDIQVSPTSLTQLLTFASAHPQAGLMSPKCYFTAGYEFHKDRYTHSDLGHVLWFAGGKLDWANVRAVHTGVDEVDHGQYDSASQSDFAVGAAMFIKSEVLRTVGMLDERYYLYFEEIDLCLRAARHAWQIWYVATALAWHANAQAAGVGSPLQDYFITRNRLLFGFTYAPVRTKFALFRQSLNLLFAGRPWQKRGVTDFYIGRFGRGSYA